MVILNSIALLVLVIWTVLFLRPDVEIIYPQGEHVLLVQSWYGDSTTEPSLEMFDDWKNGRVHLVAGESDRRKFPFNSHANDELGIGWSLRAGPLALDEVIENGEPLRGGVIPPKRAASKSRINTSPAFSAGRVSLLKPSYAFALE